MTIYSPSGAVVYEAPITKSAIIRRELMGDYYIELVFDAVDRIDIGRGCYILYNNHRFEIMNNVIPDDTNQGGLRYTLRFESQQSQMKRCNVFWREGDNLEVSFALTSDISTFGQLIIDNVNAFLGGSTFSLGSVPSGAEMKAISFAGDSCWDAVATIAETFGVEWWTEEDGDNVRLCFGKLEIGESVEFKKGDIVSSIPSKKGDDANYGTRFYIFGSTKNLPEDYGSTVEGGITNNVVEKRLHLPNGMQYIDAWPNLAPEDIVEKTVFFEDVMPTNVETITEVYSGNAEVIPGTSHKVYDVVCANSPFTLDDVIEGETIQANFTSGSLNGQTFDLELTQASGVFNKTFRIVPKILDKGSLTILPQGEMIPRAGDTFILLNVNLPKGRIDEAEQRLLEVGQEYVKKNSFDTEIYDCPTNAVYCHRNDCNYVLGQRVTLVGDMFGDGRQSRIQGYEKKLYDEYQATYTVGDNSAYSRLASLEKSIRQANYSDRVGLEANIIRSKNDATIPSDFNVYSALASEEMFLSKRRGGTVKGHTNFEKGISLYGMPIYDAEKKRWTLEGDLLVTGAMTMYGLTGGEKPSTIMDAVQVDGHSILKEDGVLKINPNYHFNGGSGTGGLDYEMLDAYLTTNGYATQDWVLGNGYITSSALEPYALKTAIPTNTNQLTNGAGFITGITSSMVTNALGYTPYNSSNPAGYITSAGSITGNAATSNRLIEEVVTDLNNATAGRIFTMTSGYGSTDGNKPTTGWVTGLTLQFAQNGACRRQLAYSDDFFVRDENNGSWGDWRKILTSTNFYDYALPITGGAVSGNLAIGGTTALEKLHVYGRGRFVMQRQGDQSSIVPDATALTISTNSASYSGYNTGVGFNALGDYGSLTYKNHIHAWIGLGGATTTAEAECYPLVFATNGSTSTGVSPIERMRINPDGQVIVMGDTLLGSINLQYSDEINRYGGNLYLQHRNGDGTGHVVMCYNGGNVGIGVAYPSEKFHVAGNILATGAITMYYSSDKRLKQNIRKINASEALMSLGGIYQYEYIDSEVAKNSTYGGSHYGLIYQNVKGTALDRMCHEREDGFGTLNYLDTNFISLIAGATMDTISEVEKLKKENKALRKRVEQLEKRVA